MEVKDILMIILFVMEFLIVIGIGIALLLREIRKVKFEKENREMAIREILVNSKQVCDDNIKLISENVELKLQNEILKKQNKELTEKCQKKTKKKAISKK